MTLQKLINEAGKRLKQKNVEDPSKEAGLLLSWILGKDLGFIYAHPDLILNDKKTGEFWSAIERRGRQEPYAYITGTCEFLSLKFDVNPAVLIPRPDTELLAEAALFALGAGGALFRQSMFTLPKRKTVDILDIGTGSGCLAVSIVKFAGSAGIDIKADAADISEEALKTASHNAEKHRVSDRVNFILSDFLTDSSLLSKKYDIVVSNPPYIPSADIPALMPSVGEFEPHTALDGGRDGLLFYRALAEKAEALLAPHGIMAVECGFDQALKIRELFSGKDMETTVLKDLAGIDRVVAARKIGKMYNGFSN